MTGITHPNNAGIGHQASGIWDMGYGTWEASQIDAVFR